MTPLDRAFEAARTNESLQIRFYNVLLNTTLFIPTRHIPQTQGFRRAGKDETFSPLVIESEGVSYVMLFDTIEKLTKWAAGKPIGYVGLAGNTIAAAASDDICWAINAGTDYLRVLSIDEIKWLKEVQREAAI